MATKSLNVQISLVTKTTAEWAAESTVIKAGMPVVEVMEDGSARMKIGDGVHAFADLKYVSGPATSLDTLDADAIIAALGYTPINGDKVGAANGVASLDENGLIPASQIPGGVSSMVELPTINDAPETGDTSKIYIDLSTGKQYRWSGTAYAPVQDSVVITASETNGSIKVNGTDIKVYEPDALDTALDEASENAVQNKVVAAALKDKIDVADTLELTCTL